MKTWQLGMVVATMAACVPQGKYDKAVQEAAGLESSLRAQKAQTAADESELSKLQTNLQQALGSRRQCDERLADEMAANKNVEQALEEATTEDAQLRDELQKLGKNAQSLVAERSSLQSLVADARAKLEELRKGQAAAEARAVMFRDLALKFHKMIDAGELHIGLRDGRMVLQLSNDVLFDTARTDIKPAGQASLREIAAVLRTMPDRRFQIAGHTDNVPIDTARFPSNWELSAGRALEVVHFLSAQGMPQGSLSAAGYGEFDPLAPNDNASGKARNRRTEITLQPRIDELVAVPAAP